jgi:hypothetical protein
MIPINTIPAADILFLLFITNKKYLLVLCQFLLLLHKKFIDLINDKIRIPAWEPDWFPCCAVKYPVNFAVYMDPSATPNHFGAYLRINGK